LFQGFVFSFVVVGVVQGVVVLDFVIGSWFNRRLLHVFLSCFVCVGVVEIVCLVLCVRFHFGVFNFFWCAVRVLMLCSLRYL